MAIITTVAVSTSAFAIHGFMARHRPFHTALRLSSKRFCPNYSPVMPDSQNLYNAVL
jgi:hypothetical protein